MTNNKDEDTNNFIWYSVCFKFFGYLWCLEYNDCIPAEGLGSPSSLGFSLPMGLRIHLTVSPAKE